MTTNFMNNFFSNCYEQNPFLACAADTNKHAIVCNNNVSISVYLLYFYKQYC